MKFAVLALCLLSTSALAAGRTWLFALGTNRGNEGDELLRYAGADAQRFAETLHEVAGLEPRREKVLTAADAPELKKELAAFKKTLEMEAQVDDRLVVFISSHADDEALHLAGTTFPLSELVRFLKAAPVPVALLVLDACRSGAATKLKGLKAAPTAPLRVEVAQMEGRIVLSSAADDEYAQESEQLGGGVFTHHLLAGLRGAADANRDGRVTLEEAYLYSRARTLESTLGSKGGAQRPAWSVELRGQGELVLSEPLRAAGQLKLAVQAPGRWLVVHDGSSAVVAEVEKGEGEATLAIAPGKYRVAVRTAQGWLERRVVVPDAGGASVRGEDLEQASLVQLARKGGERPQMILSAAGALGSPMLRGPVLLFGGELKLRREGPLLGPLNFIAFRVALRDGRASGLVPFEQTEIEPRLGVGHVFVDGRWRLSLALELGAVLVLQSELPDASHRFGVEPTLVAAIEGSVKLAGPVGVFVDLAGGGALLKKDAGITAVPRGLGAVGLRVDL